MATYFTDFSEYTTSSAPGDWSTPSGWTAPITARIDASAGLGGKSFFLDGSADHGLTWDDIDGDANRGVLDVLMKFQLADVGSSTDPKAGILFMARTGRDGYYVGPAASTIFRLRKVVGGTESNIVSGSCSVSTATWYWMRVNYNSGTGAITARIWADGAGEPGAWEISTTDTALTTLGGVGVYFNTSSAEPLIDYFAVGTNGDAAPSPGGGDVTAPVLSSPTGTTTSDTTATVGATTDEGNGTLYAFVSTSATPPSSTDLKAGTGATWAGSVAVSSTGAKTLSATGLTASTGYYAHLIHTDAAANDSNIVTSAQFTTDAAASPPGTPSTPAFDNITKTGYRVTWSAPGSGGTVSGYEYRINAGSWVDVGTDLEVTISGRTPGATDTVEVRAYGPGGDGTASTADITLPLYGFAFSTASGLVFGAIVGALTDIEVEAEAAEWTVFVHDDEDRSIVLTGSAVTIDAAGRLPDMTSATLDAGAYFVSFRRTSDGAWAAARLTTEDLS